MKKFAVLSINLIVLFAFTLTSYAQRPVVDCYGTLEAWKIDRSLRHFLQSHDCYCPSANSRPVCTPKSFKTSPGIRMRSTGDWKADLMIGLMQSFIDGFMKGLQQQSIQSGKERTIQQRNNWEEEWKKKTQEQYMKALKQYRIQRQNEFEERKSTLLGKLRLPKDKNTLKSLICSRFWSEQAKIVSTLNIENDMELARDYNYRSERALSGDFEDCPEGIMNVDSPDPEKINMEFSNEFLTLIKEQEELKNSNLATIETEIKDLHTSIENLRKKISNLQQQETTNDLSESDLLKETLDQLRKAEENLTKAEENKLKLENEIRAIREIKHVISQKGEDQK